jgi:hypothetical protein
MTVYDLGALVALIIAVVGGVWIYAWWSVKRGG